MIGNVNIFIHVTIIDHLCFYNHEEKNHFILYF